MARIQEVKNLPDGFESKIPGRSLREEILRVIMKMETPVMLQLQHGRVLCKLVAYDPVYRTEAYQELEDSDNFYIVPANKAQVVKVYGGNMSAVIQQALREWRNRDFGEDGDSEDGF